MGWVKIDDAFFRNPKTIGVGRDARLIYLAGICYCGANLTDGAIPDGALRVLAAEVEINSAKAAAARLVEARLWDRTETGYIVHDYLEYNPSSSERKGKQAAAKERMQRVRSQNVRANTERTNGEVRETFAQLEREKEKEHIQPSVVAAPAAVGASDDLAPPRKVNGEWKASGPSQELVVWWADYSGSGMPAMFAPAVGAAAKLIKAGVTIADAPALFDYCAAFMDGVTLQKMLGQLDAWRASKVQPRKTTSANATVTTDAVEAELERRRQQREQRSSSHPEAIETHGVAR